MENSSRLRIGLVGCGGHGAALAEAVTRNQSLQLVACADPDIQAANQTAVLASDVSTHTSIEALLADSEVDAIVIATPHHLLCPLTLTALRAGKHVMAEKPIAMNEREASEIEASVLETGLCYMAGYSFRFSMGRFVQELLATGAIGDIYAVTGSITMPPLNHGWLARPETGGGPLLFVGCHLVDLMLWYINDEPCSVYADVIYREDLHIDDVSAFQIRFGKGAIAQCFVSQSESTVFYEIDIRGSNGKPILRGRNFLQFEIEISSKTIAAYSAPTIIRPTVRRDNIQMMLLPELEEFDSAIKEKRSPLITAVDGRRVLKVLDAVIASGKSHLPVSLKI
jgi:predicted dehydrogenase